MKMTENDSIAKYFLRVDEVFNMIRGLGEEFKEEMIAQKVWRSLPMRLNAKISVIEEIPNLKDLNVDQLHGTLTFYEMRVGMDKSKLKEAKFRVSNKGKEHKVHQDCSNSESDQDLAQLATKLERGSGKYKGKFPFKCFDYRRVGHLSSKYPYKEKDEREEDLKFTNESQTYQKKKAYKKKGFYSKEESLAPKSDCEDSSKNESNKYLLMALKTNAKKQSIMDSKEEGVVDLEGELISALDELKKEMKKNKQLKEQLQRAKEGT